jgi:hypothetical protein
MTREERTGWLEEIQYMVTVPSLEATFADECRAIAISDAIVIVDKYEQLLADMKALVAAMKERVNGSGSLSDIIAHGEFECGKSTAYSVCAGMILEVMEKYDN